MESIDVITAMLDEIDDILETSKPVRFSSKVAVDADEILDIIENIRFNLPEEVKQAQRIIDNSDKIIKDANNKAMSIIKEAEKEAEKLTADHEIIKMAKEQASAIMDDAKSTARSMRIGAVEYADELLAKTEQAIKESLDVMTRNARETENILSKEIDIIYSNRQELRGNNKP